MKKYLIVFGMIAVSAIAGSAQDSANKSSVKPEKGSIALETGFSPFSVSGDNIRLNDGQIRAVYTVSDKIGIRLGLGFSANSEYYDNGQSKDEWAKTTESASRISITPGIIFNFAGTDKLTPYIGGEIIFATPSTTLVLEQDNSKMSATNASDDDGVGVFNTFGVGAFSGFNYYFAKNLYVGAEVGISFTSESLKNTVIKETTNGMTETIELDDAGGSTSFRTGCVPFIRLGWVF